MGHIVTQGKAGTRMSRYVTSTKGWQMCQIGPVMTPALLLQPATRDPARHRLYTTAAQGTEASWAKQADRTLFGVDLCRRRAIQVPLKSTPHSRCSLCTNTVLYDAIRRLYVGLWRRCQRQSNGLSGGLVALPARRRTRHLSQAVASPTPPTGPRSAASPASPTVPRVPRVPPRTFLSCASSLPAAQRRMWTSGLQQWALPGLPRAPAVPRCTRPAVPCGRQQHRSPLGRPRSRNASPTQRRPLTRATPAAAAAPPLPPPRSPAAGPASTARRRPRWGLPAAAWTGGRPPAAACRGRGQGPAQAGCG